MPRKKSGGVMLPWLSARLDNKEGRFIQIGNSFLLSKEVKDLSPGARLMYLAMAMESAGKREFTFSRSTAQKFGISETTAARYIKELSSSGFIEMVSCGRFARVANVYRFSMNWKQTATTPTQKGSI